MTFDEMKSALQGFLGMVAPENQATATETLTNLTDEITRIYSELEANKTTVTELTANNEKLREVNAKLFLRMGTPDTSKKEGNPNDNEEGNPNEKKPTFDELFNDKGELK